MMKIRLVKIAVQPHLVLDDGETLTEIDHPAIMIPANEWNTYSSERFQNELLAWEDQLNTKLIVDELSRDQKGNHGTDQGSNNTIIVTNEPKLTVAQKQPDNQSV